MPGRLFIVSTPIGNLGDISQRAKDALNGSSLILAEDTRVTGKLLHHFGIKTPMISCHDFNERKRLSILANAARDNTDVALVSDAGTPLISDPGFQLVRHAVELGITVIPIPGASALLAALVSSGLPCDRFVFEGFLPDKSGERQRRLEKLKLEERTLIFYVAANNLVVILTEMLDIFGDRSACIARELTKLYEEFIRKNLSALLEHSQKDIGRGEFVLIVAGAEAGEQKIATQELVEQRLQELLLSGGRLKEIATLLARETGWASSELYKLGLAIKASVEKQA